MSYPCTCFEAWVLLIFCSTTSRYKSQVTRTVCCCVVLLAALGDTGLILTWRCICRSIRTSLWFVFSYSWLDTVCVLCCREWEHHNIACLREEKSRRRKGEKCKYLLLGDKLLELELAVLQPVELASNNGRLRAAEILLCYVYFQNVTVCCGKRSAIHWKIFVLRMFRKLLGQLRSTGERKEENSS